MGRKKGKKTVFLQGGTLEQEARLASDDEPGGLHVGGAVIYRAPLSSRRTARLPSSSGQWRTCPPLMDAATASTSQVQHSLSNLDFDKSDDSLDEELKDYLDNIKQHGADPDGDGSDSPDTDNEAPLSIPGSTVAATPEARTAGWATEEEEYVECSIRPGLGYHPGLGFHSSTAAAQFADVGLDDALEGLLQQDLAAGAYYDSDSDTGSSDFTDERSNSTSDAGDADGIVQSLQSLEVEELDASTAVVVDAEGRPMAVWEQLPLQQRYPVQARQQQGMEGTALGSNRSSRKQQAVKQRTPHRQRGDNSRNRSNTLSSSVPASSIRVPGFYTPAITAAAQAACAAAAAAAEASAADRQRERRQQRSVVQGAAGGQLLPGEKKKLRRDKIAAKRAVRQSDRGVSALDLLSAVEDFVAAQGDMTLMPPAGKQKQAFIQSLAGLYGIKATYKGGSSSSGKTSLVLYSTRYTAAIDETDAEKMHQLQELLTAELTREMSDAATAAGPRLGSLQKKQQHMSPQQQQQQQQQRTSRRDGRAAAGTYGAIFQQPVAFVSAGVIHPDNEQQQVHTAAAAAAGVAAEPQFVDTAAQAAAGAECAAVEGPVDASTAPAAPVAESATAAGAKDATEHFVAVDQHSNIQQQQQQQRQDHIHLTPGGWVVDTEPWTQASADYEQAASPTATADEIMYDRAPLGIGYGVKQGLGFAGVGNSSADGLDYRDDSNAAREVDEPLPAADTDTDRPQVGSRNTSSTNRILQELEQKFTNLRAVSNPHADRRKQRRDKQAEQRLLNPNTALGPSMNNRLQAAAAAAHGSSDSSSGADACAGSGSLTLGLTAQQVKKAKKQQLRNQRRQARSAAADEHLDPSAAAAGSVSHSFAGFEVHTTGIGSRLLSAWGWREGEGLGRARQGRAEPLQAARRPKQLGLGAD